MQVGLDTAFCSSLLKVRRLHPHDRACRNASRQVVCHAAPLREVAQKAGQLAATLGLSALMAGVRSAHVAVKLANIVPMSAHKILHADSVALLSPAGSTSPHIRPAAGEAA